MSSPKREIIPQSACVRYGLAVGSYSSPFVLFMMYVQTRSAIECTTRLTRSSLLVYRYLFAPVAWPIAKLLDYVLGHSGEQTYKKAELSEFRPIEPYRYLNWSQLI